MAVEMTSEAYGKLPGESYTGPEEDWLLANGYAKRAGYTGPGVANTGASDVTPDKEPTDAVNREEAGHGSYVFGKGTALAPADLKIKQGDESGLPAGGKVVTIYGDNLADVTGVTFGGTAGTALDVVSDKEVKVTAPAHAAGAVNVVVTDPSGSATMANGFTYKA